MRFLPSKLIYVFIAVIAAFALIVLLQRESKDTRYVAYIGRYVNVEFDKMHEIILEEYLERLSRQQKEIRFELLPINIENEAANAISEYEKLSKNRRLLAVFDNTWGEHIQVAAEPIRRLGIPVVSMNADHGSANYGPTVLFNGNEDEAPTVISAFMQEALSAAPEVLIIGEDDSPMTRGFKEEIPHKKYLGVPTWEIDDTRWATLKIELREYLATAPERAVIILSTHRYWGNEIVAFIDQEAKSVDVVGPLSATSSGKALPEDNGKGNRFIFMSRPEDTLSKELTDDLEIFSRDHPDYFQKNRFNIPAFVRRCMDAVTIFEHLTWRVERQQLQKNGRLERATKEEFAQELAGLREFVQGTEIFRFDSKASRERDYQFELHRAGSRSSFPIQINKDKEPVHIVVFGIELVDIGRINLDTGSFHADFYYLLNIPAGHPELEDSLHFRNIRGIPQKRELFSEDNGGFHQKLYRMSGEFQADFNLSAFPMDEQELVLSLDMVHDTDKVVVSFDKAAFDQVNENTEFEIGGWEVLSLQATVDNVISTTMRGGMSLDGKPKKIQTLNVRLAAKRRPLRPMITITLPLLMIGFAALLILRVREASFRLLGEIMVVIFLSIVTYSIAYAEFSPGTEVLSKADLLFGSTLLVVLVAFVAVVGIGGKYGGSTLPMKSSNLLRRLGLVLSVFYLASLVAIPLL